MPFILPEALTGAAAEPPCQALSDFTSYKALFHSLQRPRFLLSWREGDSVLTDLRSSRLERAIGVVYRPETERQSHYFKARLPE
jgi:hypothetical protein